jgi:AcrR family transcriptional regulator
MVDRGAEDSFEPVDLSRERIVDAAIDLAESGTWEGARLHEVALMLRTDLEHIQRFFREKDEIVDAFFDRADRAAVRVSAAQEFQGFSREQRMQQAIMAWLYALAPHRRVVREMIGAKLEFGHLHIQLPALMRISRTVQWFRESAGYRDTLPRRALIEALHTSIYLAIFTYWMRDESKNSEKTEKLLERMLKGAASVPG